MSPSGRNFLWGTLLALIVGFLPAHLYAASVERRYEPIRRALVVPTPQTDEEYRQLVERHQHAREQIGTLRRKLRVASGAIWLSFGGAALALWLRYVKSASPS